MTISPLFVRVCVVLALLMPATAMAQTQDADDANSSTTLSTTSSTTTSSAVSSGGILMTVYLLTPKNKQTAQLRIFMQNNRVALAQQASIGGGQTLADLSGAFGIKPEQQRAFGALLRAQRASLQEVLSPTHITHEHAMIFVRTIHAQMAQIDALQSAARRMSAPSPTS